jgi:hypothetical protein
MSHKILRLNLWNSAIEQYFRVTPYNIIVLSRKRFSMKNLNLFGESSVIGFILDCAGPGIALPDLPGLASSTFFLQNHLSSKI